MAIRIRQTKVFADWIARLRDERAIARIDARLRRLALGNPVTSARWATASAS